MGNKIGKLSRQWIGWAIISTYLLFTLGPIVGLLGKLLLTWLGGGNVDTLFGERAWLLLRNTLGLSSLVAISAAALGLGTAIWMVSGLDRLRQVARKVILAPFIIPSYVYALTWMTVFNRSGWVNQLLDKFGASISPYGFLSTYVILTLIYSPIITWLIANALDSMDADTIEVARTLHGDERIWHRLILPFTFPTLVSAAGLVFVLSSVEYGVPALMQFNVYSMEIYAEFSQSGDPLRAMALALPLLTLTTVLITLSQKGFQRTPFSMRNNKEKVLEHLERSKPLKVLSGFSAIVILSSAIIPFLVLIWQSEGGTSIVHALATARPELFLSLGLSLVVGGCAVILAMMPANHLAHSFKRGLWYLYCLPLAIPAPLFGIGIIRLWNRVPINNFYGNIIPLFAVHLGRLLPFALIALSNQLRQVDWSHYEIALFSPVGRLRRVFRIGLPLLSTAMVLGFGIVAMLSLGELGASLLVVPPGFATVPLRLFNLLHYGSNASVAGLTLAMFLVLGLIGGLVIIVSRGVARD